jgi:uncharacterized protein (TIGR02145 family)
VYYARAYATNRKGTSYGEELRFTTHQNKCGVFTDERDGQQYRTVKIGKQEWMADNLNVGVFTTSNGTETFHSDVSDNGIIQKYCYENDPGFCELYGGLYDWKEMMHYSRSDTGLIGTTQGICPTGWHIPTEKEWQTLELNLGMSPEEVSDLEIRGAEQGIMLKDDSSIYWTFKVKEPANEVDFNALPAGIRLLDGYFDAQGAVTSFWSASLKDGNSAWNRHLTDEEHGIQRGVASLQEGFSVRCIKDPS